MQQQKEKKPTCNHCKRRLGLMIWTCRCERIFCQSHLPAEEHGCTYDYKAAWTGPGATVVPTHGLEKI